MRTSRRLSGGGRERQLPTEHRVRGTGWAFGVWSTSPVLARMANTGVVAQRLGAAKGGAGLVGARSRWSSGFRDRGCPFRYLQRLRAGRPERCAGAHQAHFAARCRDHLSRAYADSVAGRAVADELFDGRPSVVVTAGGERRGADSEIAAAPVAARSSPSRLRIRSSDRRVPRCEAEAVLPRVLRPSNLPVNDPSPGQATPGQVRPGQAWSGLVRPGQAWSGHAAARQPACAVVTSSLLGTDGSPE